MTLTEKPNVLILGGVGFIGRNFVHYLLSNNLVNDIRVADKMLPQTAYLSETFKNEFSRIEFKQANLTNQGSVYAMIVVYIREATNTNNNSFDYCLL